MNHEVKDFSTDVLQASFNKPILVDFWAEWCGPCRVLGPSLERLAAKNNGEWSLVKVNSDENPELSAEYGIRSIPNVKLFYLKTAKRHLNLSVVRKKQMILMR